MLGVFAIALAVGFSSFASAKRLDIYFYSLQTQQSWNSTSLDQTVSHYTKVTDDACIQSTNICTYVILNGQFVQYEQGTFVGD
jgi:hypothetical protein